MEISHIKILAQQHAVMVIQEGLRLVMMKIQLVEMVVAQPVKKNLDGNVMLFILYYQLNATRFHIQN